MANLFLGASHTLPVVGEGGVVWDEWGRRHALVSGVRPLIPLALEVGQEIFFGPPLRREVRGNVGNLGHGYLR
jgi:hypothetical protein